MTGQFQFDTSGVFHIMPGHPLHCFMAVNQIAWSDLSPFVQGYMEAMFSGCMWADTSKPAGQMATPYAFSDLAPETLARIMEDCAAYPLLFKGHTPSVYLGECLWADRQAGKAAEGFPPLTIYLGDDGKVRLKEAGQ